MEQEWGRTQARTHVHAWAISSSNLFIRKLHAFQDLIRRHACAYIKTHQINYLPAKKHRYARRRYLS